MMRSVIIYFRENLKKNCKKYKEQTKKDYSESDENAECVI